MTEEHQIQDSDLDFNSDDFDGFYYTSEKSIRKMDDALILSKLSEKYPDFRKDASENILKRVIFTMMDDTRHLSYVMDECSIDIYEITKVIYRNFSYIFNKCFISKMKYILSRKAHVRARLAHR